MAKDDLQKKIAALTIQHRAVDREVIDAERGHCPDQLKVRELKQKKLRIKDQIAALTRERALEPATLSKVA